ncbi:hypothetical protein BY996DRAFT_6422973 [Phakopsora pachyrhizi]|nr:hypothetical protein BY996DRAFT_6422973 [Phakopsora pachyrhizi]
MMQMLMQIGQSLDAVTSLGSTPETVKSTAEAIIKMVPDVGKATKSLIDTMPNKAQLEGVADKATQSAEQLGKVLKTIEQSPEDANFIKKHYKALGDAFTGIFGAVDPVFSSAFPDDKNGGQQQAGKTDGRQLNTQTEGAQKDQKDTKEKNKKKT